METVTLNDTEIPVRAYMHRTADNCVTAAYSGEGAATYENPRKLIDLEDAIDQVDWLEHGISEWRTYAVEAGAQSARLLKIVQFYEKAFDELFAHCGSNGIFNAWQKPFNCTALNLAHEAAKGALIMRPSGELATRDVLLDAINGLVAAIDCSETRNAERNPRLAAALAEADRAIGENIVGTIKCAANCGAGVPVMAKNEGEDHICGSCDARHEQLEKEHLGDAEKRTGIYAEPIIGKPAMVGGVRFGVGVKVSTVIEAAQRHYEQEVTPEKEDERIKRATESLAALRREIGATPAHGLTVRLAEMRESNGRVTWSVFLAKSESAALWDCHQIYSDTIKGRAEYEAANLEYFLGLGPMPDILAFDTDPKPESDWPHGATVKLRWCGYGPYGSNITGWAKRGDQGELVSAYGR